MIQFILMVNKQGQTRLSKYYNSFSVQERITLEGELIRKCLSRTENQCSFLEHRQYKVIYRRYASLYFIIAIDIDDDINELSFLEFIHNLVETLDKYFENVCELDIMFNIEKAHFIMDEMVMSGYILETNKANILNPVVAVVKSAGL
ncbi:clathrin adaptor complex small chain family protein [Stylonychia lemnae]|uniref:AP complex subunit sigma n=1 Tax=Stylonychia lemnae TaxID=5949 RepID=A0A078ASG9_STYLE|nr:clathrin adaptor complex small chain family protein [Stylonychia lemnae]|eukprot:CDW85119.1 clathrin adaptor complex small chain family protein [Stylonychia lemnae]